MALLLALPPFGAALWAGAMTIPGGVFDPWDPAMIDLDVRKSDIAGRVDTRSSVTVADVVIDTSGSMSRTLEQVDELWARISSEG